MHSIVHSTMLLQKLIVMCLVSTVVLGLVVVLLELVGLMMLLLLGIELISLLRWLRQAMLMISIYIIFEVFWRAIMGIIGAGGTAGRGVGHFGPGKMSGCRVQILFACNGEGGVCRRRLVGKYDLPLFLYIWEMEQQQTKSRHFRIFGVFKKAARSLERGWGGQTLPKLRDKKFYIIIVSPARFRYFRVQKRVGQAVFSQSQLLLHSK